MPAIKKTMLYSLFIVSSINISLHSQDMNMQDNEDLLLIFDDSSEEIHPLEDLDEITFNPKIQRYVNDLEFDPTAQIDIIIEDDDQSLPEETTEINDESQGIKTFDNLQPDVINLVTVPQAPEDIVILDHKDSTDQESSKMIEPSAQFEECSQCTLDQAQLEELLNMQCQQMEQYLSDLAPMSSSQSANFITIPVGCDEIMIHLNNGIPLASRDADEISSSEDDDIVPVPHDLINSVKKATKQKKKLEKKEKAQQRKSKKKNKKSAAQA